MQGDNDQSDSDYSDSSSSSSRESSLDEYEKEADGNVRFSLHEAAANNDVHQLTWKLQLSIRPELVNKKNYEGQTPLHVVAIHNEGQSHFELAEFLLKSGADVNAKDKYGRTPLRYLVLNCNLEILKLFVKFKADFTCTQKDGSSLLIPASYNRNNLDVIKFLVEDIGLGVNGRDANGLTPLQYAARDNNVDSRYEVLEYLLKSGADVNAQETGLPALWFIVKRGNWRVVELFLKYNADVRHVTIRGCSILYAFDSVDSDAQVLQKFISDFDLDANFYKDVEERTPLHYIIYCLPEEPLPMKVIKCFLINGVNINAPDENGITAIIGAVREIREDDEEWFSDNLDSFNFIIEQTDLSVAHKGVHILDYYNEDDEDDDDDSPRSIYVWKWILEHIAKLDFLSVPIHPIVKNFIQEHIDLEDYFIECTKELEIMSNTKPQNSWINFFNLLVDERKKLKNYAGNKDLVEDYKNDDWLGKFPIYGVSMKKNVKKGFKRRKLFDKSVILLSDCLPIFNSNHLVVTDIVDCILSKKDLSKFCKRRFLS